jgi:hypothetical protein
MNSMETNKSEHLFPRQMDGIDYNSMAETIGSEFSSPFTLIMIMIGDLNRKGPIGTLVNGQLMKTKGILLGTIPRDCIDPAYLMPISSSLLHIMVEGYYAGKCVGLKEPPEYDNKSKEDIARGLQQTFNSLDRFIDAVRDDISQRNDVIKILNIRVNQRFLDDYMSMPVIFEHSDMRQQYYVTSLSGYLIGRSVGRHRLELP